jgi:hypothetical protein
MSNGDVTSPVLMIPCNMSLSEGQSDKIRQEWEKLKPSFKGIFVDLAEDEDMQIYYLQKDKISIIVLKSDYIHMDYINSFTETMRRAGCTDNTIIIALAADEDMEVLEASRLHDVMRNVTAAMTDAELESIGLKRLPKSEDVFDINRSFS